MPALRDGDLTLADSSAIVHYLEAKHPRAGADPGRSQAARQDDLVRGVRRHDPGGLRRKDLLQPDRRAEIPRTAGRRGGGRGRPSSTICRRSSIISRSGPGRRRLSGRRSADAGRHRGRGPVRQLPPHANRDSDDPSAIRAPWLTSIASWRGRASRRGSSARRRCSRRSRHKGKRRAPDEGARRRR